MILQPRREGLRVADQPVSERWQDRMSDYLMNRVDDAGPAPLEEIFRLE